MPKQVKISKSRPKGGEFKVHSASTGKMKHMAWKSKMPHFRGGRLNIVPALTNYEYYQHVDWFDIIDEIRQGLPFQTFDHLTDALDVDDKELQRVIHIKPATFHRRKDSGHFNPSESERLVRVSNAIGEAMVLFEGDKEAALDWLKKPAMAFGEQRPIDMLDTEVGAREVSNLITALEHGVFV